MQPSQLVGWARIHSHSACHFLSLIYFHSLPIPSPSTSLGVTEVGIKVDAIFVIRFFLSHIFDSLLQPALQGHRNRRVVDFFRQLLTPKNENEFWLLVVWRHDRTAWCSLCHVIVATNGYGVVIQFRIRCARCWYRLSQTGSHYEDTLELPTTIYPTCTII